MDPSTPDLNKYGYQHKVYFDMQFADWKHLIYNKSIMFISWSFNLQFPEGKHRSVNIGSGNGLLPEGTKPLPEPMLISD